MLDLNALYGITSHAPIPLSECTVTKPRLLYRVGFDAKDIANGSVLLFLLPYYTSAGEGGNVSMYSVAEDYHRYCADLFADVVPRLAAVSPDSRFAGFADHAPIIEVEAAAKAGLGVYGDNGLLLTREYSSFVFIGGIYTSADVSAWETLVSGARPRGEYVAGRCPGCGACRRACPTGAVGERGRIDSGRCLSAVTQKKKLTEDDERAVADAKYVWGCDICQLVCMYTKSARAAGTLETPLSFFREKLIKNLDEKTLCGLIEDGGFESRAFSWRGEAAVGRNLRLQARGGDSQTDERGADDLPRGTK